MLMLTSYFDETGDSKDEKQKFNGMGGLLGPVDNWLEFEPRWQRILDDFNLPYIHMSEMQSLLKGWPREKIEKLSARVWKTIRYCRVLPVGSIIPMDDFRPIETAMRQHFRDPYYIAMQNCIEFSIMPVDSEAYRGKNPHVALVFDNKVEFRHEAQRLYEASVKVLKVSNSVDPPDFRDMRCVLPLQAADVIAYEIYKQYEKEYYKLPKRVRYGWHQINAIYLEDFKINVYAIMRHDAQTLHDYLNKAKAHERITNYWEKKRGTEKKKP